MIEIESYSVIYSAEWHEKDGFRVKDFAPPKVRTRWQLTEQDYDMFECFNRQRKWCAVLTPDQFREFVDHCDLQADSTPTMGSIGAPGFGVSWAPAISFNSYDPLAYRNAYVTPVPKGTPEEYNQYLQNEGMIPLTDEERDRILDKMWEEVVEQTLERFS
jgi:hypothetical protein